ncbi:hypothetical protein EYF80_067439 [Liparis tanakae]|uniref:Uncharacterized protein n=1 Tax=Liparis tanakae TaxID=230148 RepID=A0A4Z2E152_9TELE|nr:hypothetical protein EYF80_067439 [Liparis tanakae]
MSINNHTRASTSPRVLPESRRGRLHLRVILAPTMAFPWRGIQAAISRRPRCRGHNIDTTTSSHLERGHNQQTAHTPAKRRAE